GRTRSPSTSVSCPGRLPRSGPHSTVLPWTAGTTDAVEPLKENVASRPSCSVSASIGSRIPLAASASKRARSSSPSRTKVRYSPMRSLGNVTGTASGLSGSTISISCSGNSGMSRPWYRGALGRDVQVRIGGRRPVPYLGRVRVRPGGDGHERRLGAVVAHPGGQQGQILLGGGFRDVADQRPHLVGVRLGGRVIDGQVHPALVEPVLEDGVAGVLDLHALAVDRDGRLHLVPVEPDGALAGLEVRLQGELLEEIGEPGVGDDARDPHVVGEHQAEETDE